MCTSYIRRYISKMAPNALFTTRDVLCYGARTAVDKALSRLVKLERIIRVARGVFIRWGSKVPSVPDIARAKAKAFGKEILPDSAMVINNIKRCPSDAIHSFAVDGCSSSFEALGVVIQFKHIGSRKICLGPSMVGQFLRALWQLGQGQCKSQHIEEQIQDFLRPDRDEFFQLVSWMPTWFTKMCDIHPMRWSPLLRRKLLN